MEIHEFKYLRKAIEDLIVYYNQHVDEVNKDNKDGIYYPKFKIQLDYNNHVK